MPIAYCLLRDRLLYFLDEECCHLHEDEQPDDCVELGGVCKLRAPRHLGNTVGNRKQAIGKTKHHKPLLL